MRQGQYPTPPQYQNPEEFHSGYAELPLDFLDQQATEFYPTDPGLHGLDRRLSKHLSLGSYTNPDQNSTEARGYHWGTPEEQAFQEDYSTRRTPRHSRSVSLGVDSFNPSPASDAFRRGIQPRQQYSSQHQHNNYNAMSGRGGRFSGPSFAGRLSSSQVGQISPWIIRVLVGGLHPYASIPALDRRANDVNAQYYKHATSSYELSNTHIINSTTLFHS